MDARVTERELVTIYIGGGTPSSLPGPLFRALINGVQERVDLGSVQEWTVEVNPGTLSEEHLDVLADSAVNRVSMGVQTLDPQRLLTLGRIHSVEDVQESVEALRRNGIRRLNLDLIYALPGQTLVEWCADVEALMALRPEHISAYALQYEAGTPFKSALDAGRLEELHEDLVREMFQEAERRFLRQGFHLYEISNFSQHLEESRHNQHYWRNHEYYGIGAGAYARIGNRRTRNLCSSERYIRLVEAGESVIEELDVLDEAAEWKETLTSGLRTVAGVSLRELERRTGIDTMQVAGEEISALKSMKLVTESSDSETLSLTRDGMWVLDSILERLFDTLPAQR